MFWYLIGLSILLTPFGVLVTLDIAGKSLLIKFSHIPLLIAVLGCIIIIIANSSFKLTYVSCAYYSLILYVVLQAFFAEDTLMVLGAVTTLLPAALVSTLLSNILQRERYFPIIASCFALCSILINTIGIIIVLRAGVPLDSNPYLLKEKIEFFGLKSNYFALLGAASAVFVLPLVIRRSLFLIIPLMAGVGSVFMLARGTIGALFITVIMAMVLNIRSSKRILMASFLLALILGVALYLGSSKDSVIQRYLLFQGLGSSTLEGRLHIWDGAWRMFHANPILGIGFNSFKKFSSRIIGFEVNDAHNILLTILSQGGALGMLLVANLYVAIVLDAFRLIKTRREHHVTIGSCVILAMFFLLTVGMVEHTFLAGELEYWIGIWGGLVGRSITLRSIKALELTTEGMKNFRSTQSSPAAAGQAGNAPLEEVTAQI